MMDWNMIFISIGVIIGIIIIFLVCREINCWYWKVNEIITILKSIDLKLSK